VQCLEYGVLCVDIRVIHMLVVFTDSINVTPLQDIQMLSLPSRCYNVHSITYGSICMSSIQYVVQTSRVTIVASDIMDVISNVKCLSRLPDIFQRIIQAFHSVNAISVTLIPSYMPLQNEFKHNDNWIKVWYSPSKNIEILIGLYLIVNDLQWFLTRHIYVKCEISHSHLIDEVAHTTQWINFSRDTWWWLYTAVTCSEKEGR
jgi:hypothetical protein